MQVRTPFRLVGAVPVVLAGTLVACGGSAPTSTGGATHAPSTANPTAAATPTPTAALASLTCPSVDTVSSGLGVTVDTPTSDPASGLPAGTTGVTCTYTASASGTSVVVVLISGPAVSSFIPRLEAGEQSSVQAQGDTYATTAVSGVGSQADFDTVSSGGSPTQNGIMAVSGNTGVSVTVMPPASQSQLQAFASQLLG